jgi:uncharacterized protein
MRRKYYVIDVTQKCNIACAYCFIDNNLKRMNKTSEPVINEEYLDSVLGYIENEALEYKPTTVHVDFNHSGEPMLAWDHYTYLMENIKKLEKKLQKQLGQIGILFSTHTNAYLLNRERIDYIRENEAMIGISIDGDQEIHDFNRKTKSGKGTYEIIEKNIQYMFSKDWRWSPGATATITAQNMDMVRIHKHIYGLGFRHINFKIIWTNANNDLAITGDRVDTLNAEHKKLFDFFVEEAREKHSVEYLKSIMIPFNRVGSMVAKVFANETITQRCYAGDRIIVFSQEGDIYPCGPFTYVDNFKIGSVKEGKKPEKFIKHVDEIEHCKECDVRYLCGGTCPTISDLNDKGHQGIVEDNCRFTKYLVEITHAFIEDMDAAWPEWRKGIEEHIEETGMFKYQYFEV